MLSRVPTCTKQNTHTCTKQNTHTCTKQNTHTWEPLLPTKLPAYPWQGVAWGPLHTLRGELLGRGGTISHHFLRSRHSPTYWGRIILSLKEVFSNPETKVTDNGPHPSSAPPPYPGVGLALQSYQWAEEGYTLSTAGGEFTCSKDFHHKKEPTIEYLPTQGEVIDRTTRGEGGVDHTG